MREKQPNLDLIEKCIIEFIQKNKDHSLLGGLPLSEDSVKGRKGNIQKDIWCVGEWNIYILQSKIMARWTIEWTAEEETVINLNIKKHENKYQILDWDIEERF